MAKVDLRLRFNGRASDVSGIKACVSSLEETCRSLGLECSVDFACVAEDGDVEVVKSAPARELPTVVVAEAAPKVKAKK